METKKDTSAPTIVHNRVLKGPDGREPFAEKIARANAVLAKTGLPDIAKKK